MIQLKSGNNLLVVMEPANIEAIKQGHPLFIPRIESDVNNLILGYTPDVERLNTLLEEEFKKTNNELTPEKLDSILTKSLEWPVVMRKTKWVKE